MWAWCERHRFALAVTPLVLVWLHMLLVFLLEARNDWQQWLVLVLFQVAVLLLANWAWTSCCVPDWVLIVLIVVDYVVTGLLYPFLLFAVRFNPSGGWAG